MTPIGVLIREQMELLGITRPELARRLGYRNLPKGMRQIDSIIAGDLDATKEQVPALQEALEIKPAVFLSAIEQTRLNADEARREAAAARDAAWRAAFRPHAIILTERTVPSQITICGLVKGDRFKWIDLDTSQPRAAFIRQAMCELEARLRRYGTKEIPFFGLPIGFVVNLTPDCALRYSLAGEAQAIMPKAYRMGTTLLSISGSPVSGEALSEIFGTDNSMD
ncbi:hypothetical protein [Microvirga yunnanensis]|uniref:hypothetical protein n=1 Tax=Microvirga yunnanensis TaxID=2953740 RepID=UPI0021C65913|nr:hypothetical protein [Microvirga sp. HBU65207]